MTCEIKLDNIEAKLKKGHKMPTKYTCMAEGCAFTSGSEATARDHLAANPGHKIVEVRDEGGDVDAKTIEIKEEDVTNEGGGLFG